MCRYCLDANVFIEAKNGPYGMDIAPSFWRLLDSQAKAGVICSSTMVYEELATGNDELADWAKARKGTRLFVEPSAHVQGLFNQIAAYVHTQYPEHQAQKFLAGADAWVIAHAKADNAIVVTHETLVNEYSEKPKIPNVCKRFDVEWVNAYQMLRVLGARF
jgi:predicted nucleic acid-binding protein